MIFQLFTIGRLKTSYVQEGVADYSQRISRYAKLSMGEVPAQNLPPQASSSQIDKILQQEGEALLKKIQKDQPLIVLAIQGKPVSSEDFAEKIRAWQNDGRKEIQFVIGGPFGLYEKVVKQAHEKWSLSPMTFPHELCLLIFLEQLYRAHTILRNEPYHK